MWEFAIILLLVGAIALVVVPRIRKGGPRGELMHGTLLVTGVSPRPDAEGEQFVTITGVVNGPTVNEHVVYQRLVVPITQWPSMGQLIPVVYSPKNPDNWSFAPPEAPPAYEAPPSY
jgi:hypothetical protein